MNNIGKHWTTLGNPPSIGYESVSVLESKQVFSLFLFLLLENTDAVKESSFHEQAQWQAGTHKLRGFCALGL